MGLFLWKLVLLTSAAASLWWLVQPRSLFVLRIKAGEVTVVRGTVLAAFQNQVREVCRMHGITTGRLQGFAVSGGQVRLHGSRKFSRGALQQLRNWWSAHGWNSPSSRKSC
jgi:Protein of unknown function (DUF3634)